MRNTGITAAFVVSAAASLGLAIVYVGGGQPQLEGLLLGTALGGIAVGLVLVAKDLMPKGPYEQERALMPGDTDPPPGDDEGDGWVEGLARRGFLARLLGLAFGMLGIAALFPIRSLGQRPRDELFETAWRAGMRVVTEDGMPVHLDRLRVGGILTVFPDGHTDDADSQTVLIKLPDEATLPGGAPEQGLVAFSKVCTHAGCPVGLYQAQTQELFCPCHQSVFAVLEDARPTAGPATRPLPRLPIAVDEEGYVVAAGDYPEPVGPGFWNRGRR